MFLRCRAPRHDEESALLVCVIRHWPTATTMPLANVPLSTNHKCLRPKLFLRTWHKRWSPFCEAGAGLFNHGKPAGVTWVERRRSGALASVLTISDEQTRAEAALCCSDLALLGTWVILCQRDQSLALDPSELTNSQILCAHAFQRMVHKIMPQYFQYF